MSYLPAFVVVGSLLGIEPNDSKLRRSEFVELINAVEVGFSMAQTRQVLGGPDISLTNASSRLPVGITSAWCYGTDASHTLPTLGTIFFGRDKRVAFLYGGSGTPPDPALIAEDELRVRLYEIDKIGQSDGRVYNPRDMIVAANGLFTLGKEGCLAVVDEYVRIKSPVSKTDDGAIAMLLRVLFQVPEPPGYMPNVLLGRSHPTLANSPPHIYKLLPHFPVLLHEDIPLCLISGYASLGSGNTALRMNIDCFRQHGVYRSKPLSLPDDVAATQKRLLTSDAWQAFKDLPRSNEEMVLEQMSRLCGVAEFE